MKIYKEFGVRRGLEKDGEEKHLPNLSFIETVLTKHRTVSFIG